MEKVKVTKEVAEIIESLRGVVSDTTLIKLISDKCGGEHPVVTAAIAIHHGYEVDEPWAESAFAYYQALKTDKHPTNRFGAIAIEQFLERLDIKITEVPK